MSLTVHHQNNVLLLLSDEVKINILSYLTDADLAHRVASVCRDFRRLVGDSPLWKERTIHRFGEKATSSFAKTQNWKASYIALKKLEMIKISSAVEKKHKVNDVQQKTMSAASAILGLNVNNQSAYYPPESSQVFFGGRMTKFTVYKSSHT